MESVMDERKQRKYKKFQSQSHEAQVEISNYLSQLDKAQIVDGPFYLLDHVHRSRYATRNKNGIQNEISVIWDTNTLQSAYALKLQDAFYIREKVLGNASGLQEGQI